MRIIYAVALDWDWIAIRLHFRGDVISRIERDHKGSSVVRACQAMFSKWLEGEGRWPITWKTLIEALKEAGFSELASEVETVLERST